MFKTCYFNVQFNIFEIRFKIKFVNYEKNNFLFIATFVKYNL